MQETARKTPLGTVLHLRCVDFVNPTSLSILMNVLGMKEMEKMSFLARRIHY